MKMKRLGKGGSFVRFYNPTAQSIRKHAPKNSLGTTPVVTVYDMVKDLVIILIFFTNIHHPGDRWL